MVLALGMQERALEPGMGWTARWQSSQDAVNTSANRRSELAKADELIWPRKSAPFRTRSTR